VVLVQKTWRSLGASELRLLVAAIGLGATLVALRHVSEQQSCDVAPVLRLGGLPVEIYFAAWFGLMLLVEVMAFGMPPEVRARVNVHVFALSILGVAGVLWLAQGLRLYWQFGWRSREIASLSVLASFFLSVLSDRAPIIDALRSVLHDVGLVVRKRGAILASVAAFGLAMWLWAGGPDGVRHPRSPTPSREAFLDWYAGQARVAVARTAHMYPVQVVKFHDYQCPPCRLSRTTYAPVLERLSRQYPGSIGTTSLPFPLERECNPYMPSDLHPASCEAAAAVMLAAARGRADQLDEWLYGNQHALTPASVTRAAREIGGIDDFAERYPAALREIRAEVEHARTLGVSGTPTYFVNGVKLPGVVSVELFEAVLTHELARADKARSERPTATSGSN
jgi:protein-disulfide isomerase